MIKRKLVKKILLIISIIFGLFVFIFPMGLNDFIWVTNNITLESNNIRKNIPDVLDDLEYVNEWLKNSKTPENYKVLYSLNENKITRFNKDSYQNIFLKFNNDEIGTIAGQDIHIDNFNYKLLSNKNDALENLNISIVPTRDPYINISYTYDYSEVNFFKKTYDKWFFILNSNYKKDEVSSIANNLKTIIEREE
ncbi:hypothetical protein [Flavobacterium hercynium]|uniref:Uncharacterized protein n=1 Tax=Flavobacterium hercynium TaxID=387094 RepID=A0A226GPU8_9FLAO|nr:hypothetical protein [Flavobacterium hercynium]OXA83426.1 hypothetical protein B0A66_22270 [Flavobacterium hercynium]SMP36918.1 hypothetical protein SAMN06265346_12531 [Flavobacterium hercynium]